MNQLICVTESVYGNALTRGKKYAVVAIDEAKRQVRIKGDNGRTRWYPTYCFDRSDQSVPTLVSYQLDDPIELSDTHLIEVTVWLSNNERRWCVFATPASLADSSDWIEGTQIPFHYLNRHLIVAAELSEVLIERMLHYLDRQGHLIECTLPLMDDVQEDAGE